MRSSDLKCFFYWLMDCAKCTFWLINKGFKTLICYQQNQSQKFYVKKDIILKKLAQDNENSGEILAFDNKVTKKSKYLWRAKFYTTKFLFFDQLEHMKTICKCYKIIDQTAFISIIFRHRRQFVKWHYKRAAKKRQLTICIHFLWCTLFSIHSSRMKIFCELFYVACTLHRVQNSSVFLKLTKVNHKRKRQSVSHKRTKKTWRKRMTGDW